MRLMHRVLITALILPWSQHLFAATVTGTLGVTAKVIASCALGPVSPVAFGNYDPTDPVANDAQGSIKTICTINTPYNIGLGAGLGTGASANNPRYMTSTPNLLSYSLYRDVARTLTWGNTIGTNTYAAVGNGTMVTKDVYGQVPPLQPIPTGNYSDTVAITVTF